MEALGPVFVDAWGWLAYGHRADGHHAAVAALIRQLRQRGVVLYTTDYVLDELITLLFRREPAAESVRFVEAILASAAGGQLRIERTTPDRFAAAWELRKRFADKPTVSFTDLVSMVVMRERGVRQVLTEDEHFSHVGMGFVRLPGR